MDNVFFWKACFVDRFLRYVLFGVEDGGEKSKKRKIDENRLVRCHSAASKCVKTKCGQAWTANTECRGLGKRLESFDGWQLAPLNAVKAECGGLTDLWRLPKAWGMVWRRLRAGNWHL